MKISFIRCFFGIALLIGLMNPMLNKVHGQTIQEVRSSGRYYWGTGEGINYQEARRYALAMLSEGIQVEVKHDFEQLITEENGNLDQYVKSVVSTYSSAFISFYETKVISEAADNTEVMVYITKERLADYYNDLEVSIHDFIHNGAKAEQDLRIADALRNYYWALVLTRAHPENQRLRYAFEAGQEESVLRGLITRINTIFSFLDVAVVSARLEENNQTNTLQLAFTYRNKSIQDLDYRWYEGDGFSAPVNARNGRGIAVINKNMKNLRLAIEYQYAHKAGFERDVQRMIEAIPLPYFNQADFSIPVALEKPETTAHRNVPMAVAAFEVYTAENAVYQNKVQQVISAVESKKPAATADAFTPEGYRMFQYLIANGNVTVLAGQMDTLRIVKVGNSVMARSVPMLFSYHNNREKFVENVVFSFDESQKISSLSFALGDIAIRDIVNKPTGFGTIEEKYFLINFMEHYKTAFALKRLDYIESIFSDDALIIVGHVVEKVVDVENPWLNHEVVKYNTYTKQQYVSNLAANFRRNEFINIRFEDNIVRKTERDDKIYGIQIAQHYYSSTYADKGYLFLMIDLNDTINPKIYVRTWQPEKNPDGSIFGLEHFRF